MSKSGAQTAVNRNVLRGEETRTRILDAAEVLFSQRGYDGTSLRDLAAEAGVRLGLVHYHFGAKDHVLSATVDRKLGLLQQTIEESFRVAAQANGLARIEDCVSAFILPFLTISADKSHPLHNFVTMTSHLMSAYRLSEVKPTLMRLSAISEIFVSHASKLVSDAGKGNLLTGTYLMEAALIFMVQDPGFLDDLSDRYHSAENLVGISDATLRFFSAGLQSLLVPTSSN